MGLLKIIHESAGKLKKKH